MRDLRNSFNANAYWDITNELSFMRDCGRWGCRGVLLVYALIMLPTTCRTLFSLFRAKPCYVRRNLAFFLSSSVAAYEIYSGILTFARIVRIIKLDSWDYKAHLVVWLVCSGLGFLAEPTVELVIFASMRGSVLDPHAKVRADGKAFFGLIVQVFFFWPASSIVFTVGYKGWGAASWFCYPLIVWVIYKMLCTNNAEEELTMSRKKARAHNVIQILAVAVPILGFEYAVTGRLSVVAILMTVSDSIDLMFITLDTCDCSSAAIETIDNKTSFGHDIEMSSTGSC